MCNDGKQVTARLGILFMLFFILIFDNSFAQTINSSNALNDKGLGSMPFVSTKVSARIEHIRFGSNTDPLNGLTITWKSMGENDTIKWGYSSAYDRGIFPGIRRDGYEHYFYDYTFPSVKANKTIYYKIYDSKNDVWTEEKSYSTAVETTSTKFSFLAMGDSRTYVSDWRNISNAANTTNTDFTLFTGDIVAYGDDVEDWNDWFDFGEDFLEKNLVFHTIGNHECRGDGETVYPNIFTLPTNPTGTEYYYSFTYGNAVFICLDTEEDDTETVRSIQYNWLVDVLAENQDKTWKFVWFHRPFYTTGSHAGEMDYKMDTWFDAFDTYGVDMIFNGHDHMYERTKPVQKDGTVVDEYGSNPGQGRCQIVCGGSGAPLYTPGDADWLETSAKKFHYCKIEIDGYDLNFEVYDENNTMFDELKLHKEAVSVKEFRLNSKVSIYPNPSCNQITIKGDKSEISKIKIYDAQGRDYSQLVKLVKKGDNIIVADLSKLPVGLYFLKTEHTTHKVFRE